MTYRFCNDPQTMNVDELINIITTDKSYNYSDFLKIFFVYDDIINCGKNTTETSEMTEMTETAEINNLFL